MEAEEESNDPSTAISDADGQDGLDQDQKQAALIYAALGGQVNISAVDCCAPVCG